MFRIFGHNVPAAAATLGIVEAVVITLALYAITLIDANVALAGVPVGFALLLGLAILVIMYSSGLYHLDALMDLRSTFRRGAPAVVVTLFLAWVLASQMSPPQLARLRSHWPLVLLSASIWLACILVTRAIFARISRSGVLRRRVLILGQGARALRLHDLSRERFGAYFLPVGQVTLRQNTVEGTDGELQLRESLEAEDLLGIARKLNVSEIVIAAEDRRGLPVQQLVECKLAGVGVIDYIDFYERESGRIDLSALKPSWFIFSTGFRMGRRVELIKRAFDIALCLLTLVVVLPLMAFTAIAIACEDGRPILYRQTRVGFRGRNFVLFKFRSMRVDAESDGSPLWAAKRDPRTTRVGWLIRKLRIDELPQLYNVLRGDMSFVGPRPERPYFVTQLAEAIPYYSERHAVKPGVTGWAQVNYHYGASLEDAQNKLSYDLFYLKNRSLFLDLIILVRTIRVVLWPDGAR
jgi:sugar transferase (PEP-CTERM system associated)